MSAAAEIPAPSRGRTVEIEGGRRLRYVAAGPTSSARPLVILEAGSFGFSADWAAVQDHLAAEGLRSLAYDRAGLGLSDPGPAPRDSTAIVTDLERLLAALDEPGPYLVCGHSMAGMHVRLFAGRSAAQVRGLVLVDATTPEAMDHPIAAQLVGHFNNLSKFAAWGAQVGLARPLAGPFGDGIGLPALAKEEKRRAFADPVHNHWAAAEVASWHDDARQAREAGALDPDWPVAVVLTGDGRQPMGRHAIQTAPATAARHGYVIHVPGANHASLLGQRFAGHIVRAILSVEAAAKS
ncbi:MAG TPA: alpha/beta fold hydrolase [Caulobacteraceae bacterium]|nr:alpha/beta fold hydrolase [Caulobacteraceae bacterium]